ncbi:hypothetical protein ATM17_30300 (plasmid) [Sphingopyxis macrogoltabida]|uniref:Uncharacterized protein n=1 Tax=Sphingopyxis macrogoltabida TaxID=33050 RepID=A0AAC9AZ55_SPHMC|nr:hypothetical protein ATM17_30300 [Sphingopyxis macrogoltabida]
MIGRCSKLSDARAIGGLADIRGHNDARASLLINERRSPARGLGVTIGQDNAASFSGERYGGRRADADAVFRPCAGYYRDLAK